MMGGSAAGSLLMTNGSGWGSARFKTYGTPTLVKTYDFDSISMEIFIFQSFFKNYLYSQKFSLRMGKTRAYARGSLKKLAKKNFAKIIIYC
jgi:hypothetical protein